MGEVVVGATLGMMLEVEWVSDVRMWIGWIISKYLGELVGVDIVTLRMRLLYVSAMYTVPS